MNIQNFSRYNFQCQQCRNLRDHYYIHPGKVKKIFEKNGNLYLFFDI